MTHQEFDERLDEILGARDKAIAELNSSYKRNNLGWRVYDGSAEQDLYVRIRVAKLQAKQALTSLIKELVAEAKPESQSWDGLEPVVQIALSARRKAIDEFEQNLLKALSNSGKE